MTGDPVMRVVSVNVSPVKTIEHRGTILTTGIFKEPVAGRVEVRRLGLAGDRQADPAVHGGIDKAVYAYSLENHRFWEEELGRSGLGWGYFGENLTVEGMDEEAIGIGDRFRVGTTLLEVSQPRTPCHKLAIRVGLDDFPRRFLASGRVGFYLRVLGEGTVGAGDSIERVAREPEALSVRHVLRLRYGAPRDREGARRAAWSAALSPGWKAAFMKQLADEAGPRGPDG